MKNPDDVQHGGDHYKEGGHLQHWSAIITLGYGWEYYLGAATKYTTRYNKKNGAQDVSKAIHFCEKIIYEVSMGRLPDEYQSTGGIRLSIDNTNRTNYNACVNVEEFNKVYCRANGVTNDTAKKALYRLFSARTKQDVAEAVTLLEALHNEITGYVPPTPVNPAAVERVSKATAAGAALLGAGGPLGGDDTEGAATPAYVAQGDTEKPAKPAARRGTQGKKAAK